MTAGGGAGSSGPGGVWSLFGGSEGSAGGSSATGQGSTSAGGSSRGWGGEAMDVVSGGVSTLRSSVGLGPSVEEPSVFALSSTERIQYFMILMVCSAVFFLLAFFLFLPVVAIFPSKVGGRLSGRVGGGARRLSESGAAATTHSRHGLRAPRPRSLARLHMRFATPSLTTSPTSLRSASPLAPSSSTPPLEHCLGRALTFKVSSRQTARSLPSSTSSP